MLASVSSATLLGVEGRPVRVEVHVSSGIPGFTVVGLPDTTCREARDRVRAALLSSGLKWPNARMTVNLAPPGLRKVGAGLDLAIAAGLLAASEQIPLGSLAGRAFVGEVGLDGSVRSVPGALPLIDALADREVVVPEGCTTEAQLVGRHVVRPISLLSTMVAALSGRAAWPDAPEPLEPPPPPPGPDLADVRGQPAARYALEIAAAGGHHLLLVGPPGAGKTMLARRLAGLLPDLAPEHALEATCIHSAAGLPLPHGGLVRRPPFRAPHHGASAVSLVGGGSHTMQPGEVSLAHRGVLFLDELGEFEPTVLDNLRQPLEEGVIRVARASAKVAFPARLLLVAAMNPCPCGEGATPGGCRCTPTARARYARRLSGPLVDRFDLRVEVGRPDVTELLSTTTGESTAEVAPRVAAARALAQTRDVAANAQLPAWRLDDVAVLDKPATRLVERALRSGRLTGRGLGGVRRVARTIADLAGHDDMLGVEHVSAALALRAEPAFLDGAGSVTAPAEGVIAKHDGPERDGRAHDAAAYRAAAHDTAASDGTASDGAERPVGDRMADLPSEAFAVALSGLPGMGPSRLAALLAAVPPRVAWARIVRGHRWSEPAVHRSLGPDGTKVTGVWRRAATTVDVAEVWGRLPDLDVAVDLLGSAGFPPVLAGDVEPPAVLFHRGSTALIDGPRVAIVGTRRCSSTGLGVALELGRDLAAAGVAVVSGLAAGIDGAAHRGALAADAAPPIGVVGSGLDVVYPRGQTALWRAVAEAGVLLSEAPPGAAPARWRFPARNRIIAALADLVIVVESHRRGGSLHTVDEADRRAIDVLAVPGSVRNPAAAGTNDLLAEGRAPVCSVDDVLVALGLGAGRQRRASADRRVEPDAPDLPVLDAVGWQPATLDHLVLRTGLDLGRLSLALDRLCVAGWVARHGGWYERVAAPTGAGG